MFIICYLSCVKRSKNSNLAKSIFVGSKYGVWKGERSSGGAEHKEVALRLDNE